MGQQFNMYSINAYSSRNSDFTPLSTQIKDAKADQFQAHFMPGATGILTMYYPGLFMRPDISYVVRFTGVEKIAYRISGLMNVFYKVSFVILLRWYRKWLFGDLSKVLFYA